MAPKERHSGDGCLTDRERQRLPSLWRAAVDDDQELTTGQVPPGFGEFNRESETFSRWLNNRMLRWKDTSEALNEEVAQALRLIFLFLARAYKSQ